VARVRKAEAAVARGGLTMRWAGNEMKFIPNCICLTIFPVLAFCGSERSWTEYPFGVPTECNEDYGHHLREGVRALTSAQYPLAVKELSAALATPCFEIPNYELYGALAEAQCRAGDVIGGTTTIRDFECMLAVDAGELGCYLDRQSMESPNPAVTKRCFSVMCDAILLSYYENPSAATLKYVRRLRRTVAASRAACTAR
jgi:hypothetical protein